MEKKIGQNDFEKLINRIWENGQKPSIGLDFGSFWPKFGPHKLFRGFYLY